MLLSQSFYHRQRLPGTLELALLLSHRRRIEMSALAPCPRELGKLSSFTNHRSRRFLLPTSRPTGPRRPSCLMSSEPSEPGQLSHLVEWILKKNHFTSLRSLRANSGRTGQRFSARMLVDLPRRRLKRDVEVCGDQAAYPTTLRKPLTITSLSQMYRDEPSPGIRTPAAGDSVLTPNLLARCPRSISPGKALGQAIALR